ncbi:UDP-N-acetylglucosamine 2-epimerase [Micromonospora sp. M12]
MLVSTHPRTRKRLEALTDADLTVDGITFHDPFGLFDYVRLQSQARCTLSDSGTISEEAAILGFPAVTLRDSMERPEALDAGGIIMTGLDPEGVVEAVRVTVAQVAAQGCPARSTTRCRTPPGGWSTSSSPPSAGTTTGRASAADRDS